MKVDILIFSGRPWTGFCSSGFLYQLPLAKTSLLGEYQQRKVSKQRNKSDLSSQFIHKCTILTRCPLVSPLPPHLAPGIWGDASLREAAVGPLVGPSS